MAGVKTAFEIKGTGDPDVLLCEWGAQYCCIAGLNTTHNQVTALRYLQATEAWTGNDTAHAIAEMKSMGGQVRKLLFNAAFPECIIFPKDLYRHENEALEALYDAPFHKAYNQVHEWQVVAAFGIPQKIYTDVRSAFSESEFFHAYSVDMRHGAMAANTIHVHFSPNVFRVLVRASGKLMLAQTYHYTAPLDVVYYLLKIRSELALPAEETLVVLSGLIEKDSALYTELHQYFEVAFHDKTSVEVPESDYPPHFFAHFLNLAKCAS